MDSLLDRLGLYDFFNIIVAGGLVLFYSLEIDSFIVDTASYYFADTWLFGAVIVGAAYLIGLFCQQIGEFITKTLLKIKSRQVAHLLDKRADVEERLIKKITNNKCRKHLVDKLHVIGNDYSVRNYKQYANAILDEIEEPPHELNPEQLQYVYAHCICYIQNHGKDQKVEKMRALYGMAQNLVGSGLIVLLSSAFFELLHVGNVSDNYYLVTAIGALVLLAVAFERVFEYSKLTIRMTMGAYEACLEKQELRKHG